MWHHPLLLRFSPLHAVFFIFVEKNIKFYVFIKFASFSYLRTYKGMHMRQHNPQIRVKYNWIVFVI